MVPSMAMAVPVAATARPTQSGLTFQFVFMLFPDSRTATEWAIRHEQMELPYLKGIVCDYRGRERREDGDALGIFRAGFVQNAVFQGGGCEGRSSLLCRSIGFHRLGGWCPGPDGVLNQAWSGRSLDQVVADLPRGDHGCRPLGIASGSRRRGSDVLPVGGWGAEWAWRPGIARPGAGTQAFGLGLGAGCRLAPVAEGRWVCGAGPECFASTAAEHPGEGRRVMMVGEGSVGQWAAMAASESPGVGGGAALLVCAFRLTAYHGQECPGHHG